MLLHEQLDVETGAPEKFGSRINRSAGRFIDHLGCLGQFTVRIGYVLGVYRRELDVLIALGLARKHHVADRTAQMHYGPVHKRSGKLVF